MSPRTSLLALLALTCTNCAAHQLKSEARRTWTDIVLDDPMEPERVVAFLSFYDGASVNTRSGEQVVQIPSVRQAQNWLDNWRLEYRRRIEEVTADTASIGISELQPHLWGERSLQLHKVSMAMGPPIEGIPKWPQEANPLPWNLRDRDMRRAMFGLYAQTSRVCETVAVPMPPFYHEIDSMMVNWYGYVAAMLVVADPRLLEEVADSDTRDMIEFYIDKFKSGELSAPPIEETAP